jgi:hypothetical protein
MSCFMGWRKRVNIEVCADGGEGVSCWKDVDRGGGGGLALLIPPCCLECSKEDHQVHAINTTSVRPTATVGYNQTQCETTRGLSGV